MIMYQLFILNTIKLQVARFYNAAYLEIHKFGSGKSENIRVFLRFWKIPYVF